MASSKARTVKEYLAELPPYRRAALQAVRKVIAVANELGREIATPSEAKAIMGIGAQKLGAARQTGSIHS